MTIPITKKGYEALKAELQRLRKEARPKVLQAIIEAREHGDLRENAEYKAAKEQQEFIDNRMKELEMKLADSQVIETADVNPETIVFGATVRLLDTTSQEQRQYTLVGQDEADLKNGTISVQSPLGRALIGHRAGDLVEVNRPAGPVEYEVQHIWVEES